MEATEQVRIEPLPNGITVLIEEIPNVESVAYEVSIPGGIVTDRGGQEGSCLILADLVSRGAGGSDSRSLSDAFDNRGIRHSESAGFDRFYFRGSLLGEELPEALHLVSLIVRQPELPEKEVDPIRSILLQDIASLQDNPARRVMVELGSRYYPAPYNRPSHGTEDGLKACNGTQQRADWERRFGPRGSIISVAGKCTHSAVLDLCQKQFGSWSGQTEGLPAFGGLPAHAYTHVNFDSAQLQIALSYPSAVFGHPLYFAAKVALQVLSGGMFGRLFTEVREKRGLCYSVYARHSSTKDFGTVTAYAGTTPERAQETLDVLVAELRQLKGTVTEDELARAKANLKASLVIGEESSSARASSNAHDWWLDKRIRSIDEIVSEINKIDARRIDEYLDAFPMTSFTLVTLGSRELVYNCGV